VEPNETTDINQMIRAGREASGRCFYRDVKEAQKAESKKPEEKKIYNVGDAEPRACGRFEAPLSIGRESLDRDVVKKS